MPTLIGSTIARRLGAVLPLLAAKQRVASPYDWMATDAEVACPDPHCPSRLRIVRTGLRTFRREDTTVVPLPGPRRPSMPTTTPVLPRTVPGPSPSPAAHPRSTPGSSPNASMMVVEPLATPTPQPAAPSPLFTEADPESEDNHPAELSAPSLSLRPFSFDYLRADWG